MQLDELGATYRGTIEDEDLLSIIENQITNSDLYKKLGVSVVRWSPTAAGTALCQVSMQTVIASDKLDLWLLRSEIFGGNQRYVTISLNEAGRYLVDKKNGAGSWFGGYLRPLSDVFLQKAEFVVLPPTADWTTVFPVMKKHHCELYLYGHEAAIRDYMLASSDKRRLSEAIIERRETDLVLLSV